MADFVPSQKYASDFNKAKKYENGDAVQAETVNNLIEGQLFVQGIATNNPRVDEDNTEGQPIVFFETIDGLPRFVFRNIKGEKGKGEKGDNGNIMRFTDSALYARSDAGTTLSISSGNLINGENVASGDVVLDTHYQEGENYYICIWHVTEVNVGATGTTVFLRGMDYIPSTGGGGTVKIEVDDALSETSENPVQNKVIYSELQGTNKTLNNLSVEVQGYSQRITDLESGYGELADEQTAQAGRIANNENAITNLADTKADKTALNATNTTLNNLSTEVSGYSQRITDVEADYGELEEKVDARAKTIEYSWESVGADGINPFKLNLTLKDANGNQLSTTQIDFPLEQMVVGAEYDKATKDLILYTTDGQVAIPVDDIFDGLVTDSNIGDKTAGKAKVLETARKITFDGDVTGDYTFDGSSGKIVTLTVADDSHNHVIGNIDNLQGILEGYDNKFLEVDTDIGQLQDDKLDKSGGWIYNTNTGSDTPLYVRADATASYVGYWDKSGTALGYLGFDANHNPKIYTTSRGYENVIHSGNYSSYALPLTGGILSGELKTHNSALPFQDISTGIEAGIKSTRIQAVDLIANTITLGNNSQGYASNLPLVIRKYDTVSSANPANTTDLLTIDTNGNIKGYIEAVQGGGGGYLRIDRIDNEVNLENTTNHCILLGKPWRNKIEFYEFGGEFNFYKSQENVNTLLLHIHPDAFQYKGQNVIHSGNFETYIRNYMNKTILEQPY